MWFEDHLRGDFEFPAMPKGELILKTQDSIPLFKVTPDPGSSLKIDSVDIYFSYGREPMMRFWTSADARKVGGHWQAQCPTYIESEPLFAFANVSYRIDYTVKVGAKNRGS